MDWVRTNKILSAILAIVIVVLLVSVIVINDIKNPEVPDNSSSQSSDKAQQTESQEKGEAVTPTEGPLTYTEITFLSAGDIMYHRPQLRAAKKGDVYDFTDNMQYIKSIVESADYAAANFETTLSKPDVDFLAAPQYPSFNAPDSTLDSIKGAGFDMLYYSNNHCYDFGHDGLMRTMQVIGEKGFDFVGTRPDESSKTYKIVDVQGVKIGIINYMQLIGAGINGRTVKEQDIPLIDTFDHTNPEPMYQEIQRRMGEMNEQGADIIIVYMHWGDEYDLDPSSSQKAIAQKLCDMGVDAILASHPHVIQPVEVLTSSDGKHVMPCFYSMGNLISNQNRGNIERSTSQYTENGLMPILTIKKYSNGETVISKLEYISTWVHNDGTYEIIPIEPALSNPSAYGLSSASSISEAKGMTDGLVKAGVDQYNTQWQEPYPEASPAA